MAFAIEKDQNIHLIDELEYGFHSLSWPIERHDDNIIRLEAEGHWSVYDLGIIWFKEENCLHVSCRPQLGFSLEDRDFKDNTEMMMLINNDLLYGHFDCSPFDQTPTYRLGMIIGQNTLQMDLVVDVIERAITLYEEYYPAFHLYKTQNMTAKKALEAAMIAVQGIA